MDKIIDNSRYICLLCGCEIEKQFDDYTPFYECSCADASFNRGLLDQIDELKKQKRKPKFEIVEKLHLISIGKDEND